MTFTGPLTRQISQPEMFAYPFILRNVGCVTCTTHAICVVSSRRKLLNCISIVLFLRLLK